jgi:hypothetical protein
MALREVVFSRCPRGDRVTRKPIKLTWADLLIEDRSLDHRVVLSDWSWLLGDVFSVIAGTKFGDWFILRPDGHVDLLDALEGELREVASSYEEFTRLINTRERQEEWLLSLLVLTLHEQGVIPGPGQCYAFKVPPILGGKADSSNVEVMSLTVWVSLCGQLHREIKEMPE